MTTRSLKGVRRKRYSNSKTSDPSECAMAPRLLSRIASRVVVPLIISCGVFICLLLLVKFSLSRHSAVSSEPIIGEVHGIEVVNEYPHDPDAFTQGLLYVDKDTLFESTGLNGRSSVRKVDLTTGKVLAIHQMAHSYFGEGLTLLSDRLFQLTWLTKTGFIYDRYNMSQIMMFPNEMKDGWGLATDGKILFGSDGTSTLYFIDPNSFKVSEKQTVTYKGRKVYNLNELEYVDGEVWANIWMTDCIARISAKDGAVSSWIYLPELRQGLISTGNKGIDVLNGIAWDQRGRRLFVTGKLWPRLYEIKLLPMKNPLKSEDLQRLCMRQPFNFGRS